MIEHFSFLQVLKSLVANSLKRASVSKFTSIALPAIGTGNLCIPGNVAAKAMLEEVENFSKSNPNTTVTDVRIAIIETNKPVIEVSSFKSMRGVRLASLKFTATLWRKFFFIIIIIIIIIIIN